MRILYLSPGLFDKGGISRYNRFQVRALREAYGDDRVCVLSLMGHQHGDFEEPFDVSFAGAMPLTISSRALFAAEAVRIAKRCRPDIVLSAHIHIGPLGFGLSKMLRARLVQNIYGHEIWPKAGVSRVRRYALRHTDLVIADCNNTADIAFKSNLVRRRPEVVWDCVDTHRYTPGEPDWVTLEKYCLKKNGRFKVLFLGRIIEAARYKGFERLLKVVAGLPEERFEAVIAGKGNDTDHIKRLAKDLGISERTVITGAIHESDMPDIYRCADAFYLVSEAGPGMGEGIPMTPMEAMACGAPVLAGNQDGSRELIDGEGGWCGGPHDIDGQSAYLLSLAANPDFHKQEKATSHFRASTVFCYERFASENITALDTLVPG